MEGLRHLMMGAAQCILGHSADAIDSFRSCLAQRGDAHVTEPTVPDEGDHHITAFALYELGVLLANQPEVTLCIRFVARLFIGLSADKSALK